VKQILQLDKSLEVLLKLSEEELCSLVLKEPASINTDWRFDDLHQRIPFNAYHPPDYIIWEVISLKLFLSHQVDIIMIL
jgi:hypothetical protein